LSDYRWANYYSVARSEIWCLIWSQIAESELHVHAIQKLQFEACMSYAGKVMVLPELMQIRNQISRPTYGREVAGEQSEPTFMTWWDFPAKGLVHVLVTVLV
jgi:hypothetical protein